VVEFVVHGNRTGPFMAILNAGFDITRCRDH
jgi:hypothetical protein